VEIAQQITCVDCGGVCSLLTPEPEGGFFPGDLVAYRCHECLDRWDLEVVADDLDDNAAR
jgi:hypothetical protein